jgi:uncharacterized membrane protein
MKDKLLERWEMDKANAIWIIVRFGIGLFFFFSLLLPYAKGQELIGERIALRSFPGGGVLSLVILALVLGILYLEWMERASLTKRLYLVQAILSLLLVLYGILMYTVGIQSQTSNVTHGIGYGLGVLMLLGMWAAYLLEAKAKAFLQERMSPPAPPVTEPTEPSVE